MIALFLCSAACRHKTRARPRADALKPRAQPRYLRFAADYYPLQPIALGPWPSLSPALSSTTIAGVQAATMPLSTISNMSSPTPSRYPDLPVPRTQSVSEFEIEHSVSGKVPYTPSKPRRRASDPEYDSQAAYRAAIAAIVSTKARPFALSGRVPMDPTHLTLFFRSKVRPACESCECPDD